MKVTICLAHGVRLEYECPAVPRKGEALDLRHEDFGGLYRVDDVWWCFGKKGLHRIDVLLRPRA